MGYSPRGRKELDTTERLHFSSVQFKVAQKVKNPLAMQGMWVRFLGQEDPLENGMATHSSILA